MTNDFSSPRPSRICAIVGFGIATLGSFVLGLLLGTLVSFALMLHMILAVMVGYMLAMKCTRDDNELWGLVELFYLPNKGERLAKAADHAAARVSATARDVPEQVGDAVGKASDRVQRAAASATPDRRVADPDDGRQGRTAGTGQERPERTSAGAAAATPPPEDAPDSEAPSGQPSPGSVAGTAGKQPPLLDSPRAGGPDDLTRISGIGPKLADMLTGMGIHHFAQIAAWTEDELAWIDSHLGSFRGRASRDDWICQAQGLLKQGEAGASEPEDQPPHRQ